MIVTGIGSVVAPSSGLIAWTILMALLLVAGGVTAAKGRWGWVLLGLLTGGLLWFATAFAAPSADSFWARRLRRSAV